MSAVAKERTKGSPNLVIKIKKVVKNGVRMCVTVCSITVLSGVRSVPESNPSIIITSTKLEIIKTRRNKIFFAQFGNMVVLRLTQNQVILDSSPQGVHNDLELHIGYPNHLVRGAIINIKETIAHYHTTRKDHIIYNALFFKSLFRLKNSVG